MSHPRMNRFSLTPVLSLCLAVPAAGQVLTGGGLSMPSHGPSATGGAVMTGGGFGMRASLGQNTGAAMSGGSLSLVSGFFGSRPAARLDLERIHAFPSPFRPAFGHDRITFRGTTTHAKIRIYTLSGWLVRTLEKNDSNTEDLVWMPVTNFAGQALASGVYTFIAEGDVPGNKIGKLMIIK